MSLTKKKIKLLNNDLRRKIKNKSIKTIGGVDTLYFFSNVQGQYYHSFFESLINLNLEKNNILKYQDEDYVLKFLGSSGFSSGFCGYWFQLMSKKFGYFPIARIGFKNPNKQTNVLNCYVQLEAESIYSVGIVKSCNTIFEFLNFMFKIDVNFRNSQISRGDINCFINYDFSNLTLDMFSTSLSLNGYVYGNTKRLETLYFGNRSSKISFKIYDKQEEILNNYRFSTYVKHSFLVSQGFDVNVPLNYEYDNGVLWNIEYSFKREALKEYSIYSVFDFLNSVKFLFLEALDYVFFIGYDVNDIKKQRDRKKKLSMNLLWEYIKDNVLFDTFNFNDEFVKRTIKNSFDRQKEYYLMMIQSQFKHLINNGHTLSLKELKKAYYDYF